MLESGMSAPAKGVFIVCLPFPELPFLLAQLEKAKAARMAKLSNASVD